MISVRTENGKVTAWAEVINGINPFPDGTLVDTTAEFMEQHFGVDELTLTDGALTVGDTLPPVEPPKSPEQIRIEELEAQLAQQNADNIAFTEFILQTLGVE